MRFTTGIWAMALMATIASPPTYAGGNDTPPDLSGTWQLDLDRSDLPHAGGPPPGMHPGGPVGGGGGMGPPPGGFGGGPPMGGRGGRPHGGRTGPPPEGGTMKLPNVLVITQTATLVSLADSSGAVVRELVTVGAEADTLGHAVGAEVARGVWRKQKLETERPGPFEEPVRETYSLEAKGNRLVVSTKVPGNDYMPPRTIKRVYQLVEPKAGG